jgi:uroporphyrinogen III methyltransferase/synthase
MSTIQGASSFEKKDTPGKVWIAGAGPGDPDLATVKVLKLLRSADVVFYDALGTHRLIAKARGKRVFVGKRNGLHQMSQEEINRLLAEAALQGKKVLRLKGGDPFVFGRGSEELDYLRERGLDAEVVPGVSSVLAAAAEAGAPLTERGVAVSCSIASGWPAEKVVAPSSDTSVYVMAAEALPRIARANLDAGRPGTTPVVLVSSASLPEARVWHRTLEELLEGKEKFPPPLTVILGESARSNRPGGTRPRPPVVWYTGTDAESYKGAGRILHYPFYRVRPLPSQSPSQKNFDQGLFQLAEGGFSWALFTSRWAFRAVLRRFLELGMDLRMLAGIRLAALGRVTAAELRRFGLHADLVPAQENLPGLVQAFPEFQEGEKQLFYPSGEKASSSWIADLEAKGWSVCSFQAFGLKKAPSCDVDLKLVDRVVFTTRRAVVRFHEFFPEIPGSLVVETRGDAVRESFQSLYPNGPRPLSSV